MEDRINDTALEEALLSLQKGSRMNPLVNISMVKSEYENLSGRNSSFLYLRFEYSGHYKKEDGNVRFSDEFFEKLEEGGRIHNESMLERRDTKVRRSIEPLNTQVKKDYESMNDQDQQSSKPGTMYYGDFFVVPSQKEVEGNKNVVKRTFMKNSNQEESESYILRQKDVEIKELRQEIDLQRKRYDESMKEQDSNYEKLLQSSEKQIDDLRKRLETERVKSEKIDELEKTLMNVQKFQQQKNQQASQNDSRIRLRQEPPERTQIQQLERKLELTKRYYRTILKKLGDNQLKIFKIDPNQITFTGKVLGDGSFGKVKEGFWNFNRTVAIKEVKLNPMSGKSAKKQVIQEFESQIRLIHPNCLRVFGYSEPARNVIQIIMEKMDMDLFDFIQTKKPLLSQKIDFMQMMSKSLYYLHHQKPEPLLHRDIKSQNFLVSEDGKTLKICDFGLMRTMTCSMTFIQSKFQGTVLWMAPEVVEMQPRYSIYSDIYALGVTFWEMLFERVPFDHLLGQFQGPSAQIFILNEIKKGARPEIRQDCTLPTVFIELMKKMWHQEPRKRIRTEDLREMFKEDEVEKLKRMYGNIRFP